MDTALETAIKRGLGDAQLPFIDDSNCPDAPEEHTYLNFGINDRGTKRVLARLLHKLVLDRVATDGWAHSVT